MSIIYDMHGAAYILHAQYVARTRHGQAKRYHWNRARLVAWWLRRAGHTLSIRHVGWGRYAIRVEKNAP